MLQTGRVAKTPEPLALAFGQMVREARLRLRKTQRQIARETGYDAVSLSRAEGGEITPGLSTAVKLMAVLGLLPAEMDGLARVVVPSLKIRPRAEVRSDDRLDVLCRMMPRVIEALSALAEAADLPLVLPSRDEIARLRFHEDDPA